MGNLKMGAGGGGSKVCGGVDVVCGTWRGLGVVRDDVSEWWAGIWARGERRARRETKLQFQVCGEWGRKLGLRASKMWRVGGGGVPSCIVEHHSKMDGP